MNTKINYLKRLMLVAIPTLIATSLASASAGPYGKICFYYNGVLVCI